MLLHIGIDDTDSPKGGCTTYIAALLVEKLIGMGAEFVDYPNLVRLNPNVPWKTRGNGAVCLRIILDPSQESEAEKTVLDIVESLSDFDCDNTNPGIVFHRGEVPETFKEYSSRVIQGIVTLNEAEDLISKQDTSAIGFKNMRGIIGALAAVGEILEGDHTFELLAYRAEENRGSPRRVDERSVIMMDMETNGETFNNVDPVRRRPLITPNGPDPILFGIRGESPEAVHRAGRMVKVDERVERRVVFRTNQGTDAHLQKVLDVSDIQPYTPSIIEVEVAERPTTIKGGHVIFPVADRTGRIFCAAYEPTRGFREVVRKLIGGDRIRAYGTVKSHDGTFNLEKVDFLELAPDIRLSNPRCPSCGGGTESIGRGQGFRCRKCGSHHRGIKKVAFEMAREIEPGVYLPALSAQRHLTKPLSRYGREKREYKPMGLIDHWYWP